MKRKERFFDILLSLVLMLGLMAGMSLSAHAETTYNVRVGGVQVTSANRDNVLAGDPVNDGKVSFALQWLMIRQQRKWMNPPPPS